MRIMMKMIRKQKIERIDYLWVMRQQVVKAWKFCFSFIEADLLKIFLFFSKKNEVNSLCTDIMWCLLLSLSGKDNEQ